MVRFSLKAVAFFAVTLMSCSLFEPREPEQPTQTSSHYTPPDQPEIVISNLQYAVEEKNPPNYIKCFASPQTSTRPFTFNPSTDVSLGPWGLSDEQTYFQNLCTSTGKDRFSQLVLTLRNTPLPLDTVQYEYSYALTFMHTKTGVPTTVMGHMELALARQSNGFWAIYDWSDFKDSSFTWSRFKVEFQ